MTILMVCILIFWRDVRFEYNLCRLSHSFHILPLIGVKKKRFLLLLAKNPLEKYWTDFNESFAVRTLPHSWIPYSISHIIIIIYHVYSNIQQKAIFNMQTVVGSTRSKTSRKAGKLWTRVDCGGRDARRHGCGRSAVVTVATMGRPIFLVMLCCFGVSGQCTLI